MCSCQHITISPSRWIKALVRKHLHWSRSEQSLSIMYYTWWAGRALSVLSVPSVALVLCDSITDRRHLLSHPSSLFVLFFNYIAFQTSSVCCIPVTLPWTSGIALQLNATVTFSKRDLPAAISSALYLVFYAARLEAFLYDAFMQNASVWLNVGLTALLVI